MRVLRRASAFEVCLYMGSRKGYGEEQYAAHHVVRAISEFQQTTKQDEPPIPVRVSPTTFVSKDYVEEGWEIAVVRYPYRLRFFFPDHHWQLDDNPGAIAR